MKEYDIKDLSIKSTVRKMVSLKKIIELNRQESEGWYKNTNNRNTTMDLDNTEK